MTKGVLRYWLITRSGRTITDAGGQEMFCGHRRFAGTTKLSDKMCFWSTAGTKNISSGAARYPEFRTYEILLLFRSRAGFAKCWRLHSHPLDVAMQDRADAAK